MEETPLAAIEPDREALLRRYAKGEVTWHELRERGFDDYVEVLAGLGELALRPPVARLEGPNREALSGGARSFARPYASSCSVGPTNQSGCRRVPQPLRCGITSAAKRSMLRRVRSSGRMPNWRSATRMPKPVFSRI